MRKKFLSDPGPLRGIRCAHMEGNTGGSTITPDGSQEGSKSMEIMFIALVRMACWCITQAFPVGANP